MKKIMRGVSLVEIMVAILIIGIAFFGFTRLAGSSLKSANYANAQKQVNLAAQFIVDRISANLESGVDPNYYNQGQLWMSSNPVPGVLCDQGSNCTQLQVKSYDLYKWQQYLATLKISGLKGIVCLGGSTPGVPTISSPNCMADGTNLYVKLVWQNNLVVQESANVKNYLIVPVVTTKKLALERNWSSDSGGGSGSGGTTSNPIKSGDCSAGSDCSGTVVFGGCASGANCTNTIVLGNCSGNCTNSIVLGLCTGTGCGTNTNSSLAAAGFNSTNMPLQSATCSGSNCYQSILGGDCTGSASCQQTVIFGSCSSSNSCYNSIVFGDCSGNSCQNSFIMGNCSGNNCSGSYILGNCTGATCQGSYIGGNCTGSANCYGATIKGNCTTTNTCQGSSVAGSCTGANCNYLGSGSSITQPTSISGISNLIQLLDPVDLANDNPYKNINFSYPEGASSYSSCSGYCNSGSYYNCNGQCTGNAKVYGDCTGSSCSNWSTSNPFVVFGNCGASTDCQTSIVFGNCAGNCQNAVVIGQCTGNCQGVKRPYNADRWNPVTKRFD